MMMKIQVLVVWVVTPFSDAVGYQHRDTYRTGHTREGKVPSQSIGSKGELWP